MQRLVIVDVELTRLAYTHDQLDIAWADLGPHHFSGQPVHALLPVPNWSVLGHPHPHPQPLAPHLVATAAQLVTALSVAPLAAFDPTRAGRALSWLFTAAGHPAAPWCGVIDLDQLFADATGPGPSTLTAACAALGIPAPNSSRLGPSRVTATREFLSALETRNGRVVLTETA